MLSSSIHWLLHMLSLPEVGLGSVFLVSLISATLLPMGSEPAVFAVVKISPEMTWTVIAVATFGNTMGGMIDYWMGYGAKQAFARERQSHWFGWLERFGAKAMLLAWLPIVGDPLCTLAGWQKLPFWPSVFYMAIGKFLRYVAITFALLQVPDGFWRHLVHLL
jgi:membrane protein YqaA with SNARE-associated domain